MDWSEIKDFMNSDESINTFVFSFVKAALCAEQNDSTYEDSDTDDDDAVISLPTHGAISKVSILQKVFLNLRNCEIVTIQLYNHFE